MIDADGLHVMPGAIDAHIHLGQYHPLSVDAAPGTALAALGGVTSLVNYFKSTESYLDAVPELIETFENHALIDAAFHLQLLTERQLEELAETVTRFGITSYKINLAWKGREQQVFASDRPIDNGWIWSVMKELRELGDEMVLNIHSENAELKNEARRRVDEGLEPGLEFYEKLAPDLCETDSVMSAMMLARQTGVRTYLVHLTSALSTEALRLSWASENDRLYGETCIHYLTHTVDNAAGLLATVSPPIRFDADREALWQALADGRLQAVGSDSNPIMRAEKLGDGDFWSIKPGFDCVGLVLPTMLSGGYHDRGMSLSRIAEVVSLNPARIFGLYPRKGTIAVGSDADLALVDLDQRHVVGPEMTGPHSDFSIYDRMAFRGWPQMTISRGEIIARNGEIVTAPGRGRYLRREVGAGTRREPAAA